MNRESMDADDDGIDVLSSIRKLVAEEEAESQTLRLETVVDESSDGAEAQSEAEAEPIILGEAFRVAEDDASDTQQELTPEEPSHAAIEIPDASAIPDFVPRNVPAAATEEEPLMLGAAAAPQVPEAKPTKGSGFFDEPALRAMVSEIVREELQGELGERITRNVRKIVRREVLHVMDLTGTNEDNIAR